MICKMTLVAVALVVCLAQQVEAGLFFGANTRITEHHHYYGSAPVVTSVPVMSAPVTVYSTAPVYSVAPVYGVATTTHVVVAVRPHRAARHAAKAAKHAVKAAIYSGN